MPEQVAVHDGQVAQVLVEMGKLSTQISVVQATQEFIKTQVAELREPQRDHENRIRLIEQAKPKTPWPQIVAYLGVVLPTWALVIDLIIRHG